MIQEKIILGPIHEWLPHSMKLSLGMSGDQIVEVETEFGFLCRSIESEMIGKDFQSAQLRFGRIDPESTLILDRMYSEAIEKIYEIEVSERVLWIREITTNLSEMIGNLKYLSMMSDRLGLRFLSNIILKHREVLLDLIELLTGSRYGYYFLIPGGARYELTEGFQERVESWTKAFRSDFSRIESLFEWTHAIHNRLGSLGQVLNEGAYGFVSEASIEHTRYGAVSSVESRLKYALLECSRLNQELQDLMTERALGRHLSELKTSSKSKETAVILMTGRGPWSLSLKLNNSGKVEAVAIKTPSELIVPAIKLALEQETLEDLPLILQSLNLSIPEIDR